MMDLKYSLVLSLLKDDTIFVMLERSNPILPSLLTQYYGYGDHYCSRQFDCGYILRLV